MPPDTEVPVFVNITAGFGVASIDSLIDVKVSSFLSINLVKVECQVPDLPWADLQDPAAYER